jgi:hypothetical protein
MQLRNRKNSLASVSGASGSVYDEALDLDAEGDPEDVHDEDAEGEDDDEAQQSLPPREYARSRSGRRVIKTSYVESDYEEEDDAPKPEPQDDADVDAAGTAEDDEEENLQPRRAGLRKRTLTRAQAPPSVSDDGDVPRRYTTRLRSRKPSEPAPAHAPSTTKRTTRSGRRHVDAAPRTAAAAAAPSRPTRRLPTRRSAHDDADADGYIDEAEATAGSSDAEMEDAAPSSDVVEPEPDAGDILVVDDADDEDGGVEVIDNDDGKPYALRQRRQVNYAIPPPLDEIPSAPPRPKKAGGAAGKKKAPGWSANGAELGRFLGLPGPDDSDSDAPTRRPGHGLGGPAFAGGLGTAAPANLADLAAAGGGPANFGKVGDAGACCVPFCSCDGVLIGV